MVQAMLHEPPGPFSPAAPAAARPDPALRVLMTNLRLSGRTGTELYLRDLGLGLLERGHRPMAYSPRLGPLAEELRAAGIPVVDDLRALAEPPDVIHGQQHPETIAALLRFPKTPALYVCHDRKDWHSEPPRFPRILRYVAVDESCRARIRAATVPEHLVRVVFNGVDLDRFRPRAPLPPRPRRALVFSNDASDRTFLPAAREACIRAGLEMDVVGKLAGRPVSRPEAILGRYDLVFAKGRCALEALAVGTAVILLDLGGAGPMVTRSEIERIRRLSFGRQLLAEPIDPVVLGREIARYDPSDAAEASRWIRQTAGLDVMVAGLLGLYAELVAEGPAALDAAADEAAAARYFRRLGPLGRAYCRFYQSRLARLLVPVRMASWPLLGPALRWLWLRFLVRGPR
jgi:glycosyl transferase family 4